MLSTLLGTAAGKAAAATLTVGVATGAMASTDTLPGPAQDAVANVAQVVGIDLPGGDDEDEGAHGREKAELAKRTGEAKKAASEAFTTAKKRWTSCVGQAAPQHEGDEAFDPEEACGDKPRPHDFGLTGPPDHAKDGKAKAEDAKEKAKSKGAGEDAQDAGEADDPDDGDEAGPDS